MGVLGGCCSDLALYAASEVSRLGVKPAGTAALDLYGGHQPFDSSSLSGARSSDKETW